MYADDGRRSLTTCVWTRYSSSIALYLEELKAITVKLEEELNKIDYQ